jgi:enamine deaminase RidA (YjgF/YER057c/UK114 family)
MGKAMINPPSLTRPRGFSHGVLVTGGTLLFLAGQTASDTDGQIVAPGNLVAQYEQVLRNLQTVVEASGGAMQDIVKITIFVSDRDSYLAQLKALGSVHKAFFGNYYPATALLEISRFYQDDALIEIEGMAVIGANE